MAKKRMFLIVLILFGLLVVGIGGSGPGASVLADVPGGPDPLDTWVPRTFVVHLAGVSFGNNVYVAVGGRKDNTAGAALTSDAAGNAWTQTTPGQQKLNGVAFGKGTFVGVGPNGTILRSTDGTAWVSSNSGTTIDLNSVAYGNNVFVAVGGGNVGTQIVLTSSDGVSWTQVTSLSPWSTVFYNVSFVNNKFIVEGWAGYIYYSSDGITWSARQTAPAAVLYGTAFGNGRYVSIGTSGSIVTSTNLKKWFAESSPTSEDLFGIAFDGVRTFVAVGARGTLLRSIDGTTWTAQTFLTPGSFTGVSFVNGSFIAVGEYGLIAVSSDGAAWTTKVPASAYGLADVTFGNNTFVGVGNGGTILTSANGMNWTLRLAVANPPSGLWTPLYGVAYGNNIFVAVGLSLYTSTDNGVTWIDHSIPSAQPLYGVAFGNNTFVAVGYLGAIFRSSDGTNWTPSPSGTSWALKKVMFTGTEFIAVGDAGTILTSPDGSVWIARTSNVAQGLTAAAFGTGASVAIGTSGTILTSSGDANWTARSSGTTAQLNGVSHGNNTFIAVGDTGTILTSHDGRSGWLARNSGDTSRLYSVAYGNNTFIAVGVWDENYSVWETPIILQSGPLAPLDPPVPFSELLLNKNALDFGKVKRGTSLAVPLTMTNLWTGALELSAVITGSQAGEFALTGSSCGYPLIAGPDKSCTMDVTFTPAGPFNRTATLTLSTNDPDRPAVDVPLAGIGLQPIISPSAASLSFQSLVGYPATKSLQIANNGNDTLSMTLSLTGPNANEFIVSGSCYPSGNVSANGLCWLFVSFYPASTGSKTAALEILSNDPDTPRVTISLQGQGVL